MALPDPTITGNFPVDWQQLMLMLAQMGQQVVEFTEGAVTTVAQSDEALEAAGWVKQDIYGVVGHYWTRVQDVDATQTNAVGQYLGSYLETAGTVGSYYAKTFFSEGGNTVSKLTKLGVLTIVLSLLTSTLNPSVITDAFRGRLNAAIDLFADEDGNIPVVVTKDGKTYFHEDMINAIRQLLIDEGVYDSGEFEPSDPLTSDIPFKEKSGYSGSIDSYTASASTFNTVRTYYRYLTKDQIKLYNNGVPYSHFTMKNVNTGDIYEADGYVLYALINNGNTYLTCTPIFYSTQNLPSGQVRCDLYCDNTRVTYSYESFDKVWLDGSPDNYVYYCNQTVFFGSDSVTAGISANNVPIWAGRWPISGRQYDAFYYLVGHQGSGGIEGVTISDDLITRGIGNAQTALDDIFPSFATDYQRTADPLENALDHFQKWYPISSFNADVWTDGITEQESETATDGQVATDTQPDIADAVKQILEDYYRDPNDPTIINYPEIPVSDSGDTPPAEPPLLDAAGNGLWAIYNPTKAQVNSFGQWLWSSNIVDQITRMFNSPIDAVIGFHMIYCTPTKGSAQNIMCGFLDSGVSSITVANQYVTIDCGSVTVDEFYRTVLDYTATKLSLYLPFIGFVPLSTAVCMGSTLNITYRIDVLTGTCLAQVKVIKENSEAIMYTFPGNCSVQVPLTATTYTGMISTLVGVANTAIGVAVGSPGSVIAGAKQALEGAVESVGTGGVKQSGAIGSNAGALGIRIPYLVITHPVAYDASEYSKQYGYPLNETIVLGNLSGYTRVKDIHLQNIPCTDDELEMIERLLKDGVIIN